jgi:hypothetical protein
MTWGELRKCRARTRSSERSGVGACDDDDDDDDDASSDEEEELGGGVSVERGLDSDGPAGGCELSSLLAVIARLNGPSRFPVAVIMMVPGRNTHHDFIPIHHKSF